MKPLNTNDYAFESAEKCIKMAIKNLQWVMDKTDDKDTLATAIGVLENINVSIREWKIPIYDPIDDEDDPF